ncbi:MAG TPA: hypothetical protein VGH16_16140 [Candidatus Binatia bacterium]
MTPGAKLQDGWKILVSALVCVTTVFIFLVALASPGTDEDEDKPGQTPGLSSPEVPGAGTMGGVLKDFQFIPGSAVMVDATHVLAMFQNPEKQFYAVALFSAKCEGTRCTPTELIAFSIVDNQGRDVELANGAGRGRGAGQEI